MLGSVGGGSAVFATAMDWERDLPVRRATSATMERLLETSIAYARTRTQFGQAIGKFQAVAHQIADMKVQLEAARLLMYRAAWRLEHVAQRVAGRVDRQAVRQRVAGQASALDTVQIHGGYGFMTEYEVERALRDAVGSTLYSGTSRDAAEHHRALAGALARPIGGPFRLEKRRFSRRFC